MNYRHSKKIDHEALRLIAKSTALPEVDERPPLPESLRKAFVEHQKNREHSNTNRIWAAAAVFMIVAFAATLSTRLHQIQKSGLTQKQTVVENYGSPEKEIATEFFPLMEGETPLDTMQVVRVKLPRSALLQLGLPMNETREEESITADVLLSEDGLPYAIRFINHQEY